MVLRKIGATVGTTMIFGSGTVAGISSSRVENLSLPAGRSIEVALAKMEEYIQLKDGYLLIVDVERAQSDHVGRHARQVALDYAELNNLIVRGLEDGEFTVGKRASERIDELLHTFEPYFMLIATGETTVSPSASSSNDSVEQEGGVTTMDGGCGGNRQNPHPCPSRRWSGVFRNTKSGIKNYLRNHGYHETAGYAAYETDIDWTNCIYAYGCGGCAFRSQAIIRPRNGQWSFNTQRPEPNPEILGYTWPTWNWGTYVEWWHSNYC